MVVLTGKNNWMIDRLSTLKSIRTVLIRFLGVSGPSGLKTFEEDYLVYQEVIPWQYLGMYWSFFFASVILKRDFSSTSGISGNSCRCFDSFSEALGF